MAQNSDINFGVLVTLGAAGVLMLIVIVIGVEAWVDYQDRAVFSSELQQGPVVRPLDKLRQEQIANIETVRHDKDGKAISIPINQAMKILIDSGGNVPTTQPASSAVEPVGNPGVG